MHKTNIILVVLLCFAQVCVAQAVWTKKTSQTDPTIWVASAMAYDAKRGNTVLYGNRSRPETWVWNGTSWKLVATTGPSAKLNIRMVYDTKLERILLVASPSGSPPVETWRWKGTGWTQLSTNAPSPRSAFAMAYDTKRQVLVLFGGQYGGSDLSDTWEFDGTWRQRSSGGPPGREDHEMTYDEARGEVVLFGGQRNSSPSRRYRDTWVWDGRSWLEHFGIVGPGARVFAGMTYDSKRSRVVLSGGTNLSSTYYDDTWEWNGTSWQQQFTSGRPSKNLYGEMVYDSQRGVVVYHMGNIIGSETWEYTNRQLPKATYTSFGTGCAGSVGVPVLAATTGHLPRLGSKFDLELTGLPAGAFTRAFGMVGASNTTWLGGNLPFDLRAAGMPGCNLLVSMDILHNLSIVSGKATWSFQIPTDPTVAGGQFYLQGLVFEPGINQLGAIVSNAGAGRIGL